MSAIPPKQVPDPTAYDSSSEPGGGMVAMYNAASHANAEAFPVLKAFQDYLEAERTQARKRVVQLSVFFAVLMCVVVTGFLSAGIFMLRNMSSMQNKLLDVALANKTSPAPAPAPAQAPAPAPVAQTSPALEESMKQMSRATTELQSSLSKKLDGVNEIASQVNEKVASQDSELAKLRLELSKMQEQSTQLKKELVSIKTESKRPVAAPAPARPPAKVSAKAVAAPPAAPAAETTKPEPRDPRFPPAVKPPPTTPAGVTAPSAPQGMTATAIPLKTKNVGTIPWRVLIPE